MAVCKKNVWEDVPKEEVEICTCGNKFWVFWHRDIKKEKVQMTVCAPCYFKL